MRNSMIKVLALVGQAAFVAMSWTACSGGGNGSDAGPDSTAADVGHPDKSAPDVGQQDQGNMSCEVQVTSSNVHWAPARAINPTGCSSQEISDYLAICLDGTNTSACTSWQTAHPTCYACVYSNDTDSSYGPAVGATNFVYVNAGGCLALLTGDNTKTGCGAALWLVSDCEDQACGMCPDQTTYSTCLGVADTDPMACQSFFNAGHIDMSGNAAGTACASVDAGAYAACNFNAASFDAWFTSVATVMCGGYTPTDGGTDAAADAPADAPGGG